MFQADRTHFRSRSLVCSTPADSWWKQRDRRGGTKLFFWALFFFLSAITWDQSDTAPEPGRGAEGSLPLKAAAGLGDVQAAKPCSLCPPWKKSLLCCPAEGRKPRREGGSAPPEAPLSHRREFGGTGEAASTPGARSTPPCKSPKILLPHPRDKNKSQQLGRADQGSF